MGENGFARESHSAWGNALSEETFPDESARARDFFRKRNSSTSGMEFIPCHDN